MNPTSVEQVWRDSTRRVQMPCPLAETEAFGEATAAAAAACCRYQQQQHNSINKLHTNNNNKSCRHRSHRVLDSLTSIYERRLAWPISLRAFPLSFALALCLLCVLLCHVVVDVQAAPPKSCILCDNNDRSGANEPETSNYEEFLFEHQVSRQDAINALKVFNASNQAAGNENSCKSIASCSKEIMKYCLSPQFINDHCWCELGHTEEGLPFVPHICYVSENKVFQASVGSCFFYEEIKECCCAKALAKQWRHISSALTAQPLPLIAVLTAACLAARCWRLVRAAELA